MLTRPTPVARVVWATGLAGASAVLLGALASTDVKGWLLAVALLAPLAVLLAGATGGGLVGAEATGASYLALGIYLGVRYPSTGLCFFDCDLRPDTFMGTAGPVWFVGIAGMLLAAFGGILGTRWWRAALLGAAFLLGVLGVGWNALAPERWEGLGGLLVPAVLAFSGVLFVVEVRRLAVTPPER